MANVIDYAWGQCTWFAAHALTWLGVPKVGALGNAKDWLANVQAKGLPVSKTPSLGAAVVYSSNYPGSQGDGHVGVVTAINPNGTFQVASDNWGAPGVTHLGTSTMTDVLGFIPAPSVAAGQQGAQNALAMLKGGGGAVLGGTYQGGASASTVSATSAPGDNLGNWNPFDPNSVLRNPGGAAQTVSSGLTNWVERGFIIAFGAVILIVGLIAIFKGSSGGASGLTSTAQNAIGEAPTEASDEVVGGETSTVQTRGPRGGNRGTVTTTKSRTRRKAASKGSGLRRLAGSKVGKVAEVAE